MKDMNCTLNSYSSTSSHSVSGSVSINIGIFNDPAEKDLIDTLAAQLPALAAFPEQFNRLNETMLEMDKIRQNRKLTIDNSIIDSTINMKTVKVDEISNNTELKEQFMETINAATELELSKSIGPHAMSQDVKSYINKVVRKDEEKYTNTISNTLNEAKAEINQDNSITIRAPTSIEIKILQYAQVWI